MAYRHEVQSVEALVQYLAANLLPHGYWFYVTGLVPPNKDPSAIDAKLVAKYGAQLSRQQRVRRKLAGMANVHYLRCGRWWVLLATHGKHKLYEDEANNIRDLRKAPLHVGGYSLTVRQGGFLKKESSDPLPKPDRKLRVRVQIARERYCEIKAYFLSIACHRSSENLAREFYYLPFEPYAPIRRQLLNLLRLVNQRRKEAGYQILSPDVIRYRREIVKVFEREGFAAQGKGNNLQSRENFLLLKAGANKHFKPVTLSTISQ